MYDTVLYLQNNNNNKKAHRSGPTQLKPMWFKGQLYLIHAAYVLLITVLKQQTPPTWEADPGN